MWPENLEELMNSFYSMKNKRKQGNIHAQRSRKEKGQDKILYNE